MRSVFGGPVRGHIQVELLSAYLDQQATPAERAYVDAHLQQCTECRAELESLRRTVLLLRALPRVAVPHAFTLSEAQVGIRRPAASPGWFGGLVRGLGAVAAIALVAVVAFSMLRSANAPWSPPRTVARVAPTAAPAAKAVVTQPMSAAAPDTLQAQQEAPAATAAELEMPLPTESVPSPAPEPAQPALMAAPDTQPAEAGAADTAAAPKEEAPAEAAPEPTVTVEAPMLAKAASSPATTESAPEGAGAAAVAAAPAPMIGAPLGRGGGGPSEPVGIPPQYLAPEPTPPGKPLATALPSGLRLAYSDLNALWAIDGDGGVRQLVQGRNINTPQLSPDQQWIAYRISTDKGLQVWVIQWQGGKPRLLLDDAKLPAEGLPAGYVRRAISDTRWAPKGHVLAVTLSLVPGPDSELQPKVELWQIDAEMGDLKFSSELGRAWRPFYSPDGSEYLVLQYGAEEKPEGSLSLVDTRSGKGKTLLTFPASPGKNSYESQIAWTPDSQTAWVAIPTADYGAPAPPNGTKIYRVTASGDVKEAGEVDAAQVYWSPTGTQMAYVRYTDETLAENELYLANADGSQAQLYTPMTQGEFLSWSPDGARFIYQDDFQVFVGAPGAAPGKLANATSEVNPRWVSNTQILASHDTGDGWVLTLRDINGEAATLLPLPRDAMWDAVSR